MTAPPVASAEFSTAPAAASAAVITCVAVNVAVSVALIAKFAIGPPVTSAFISMMVTSARATLPVFVTANEKVTVSPSPITPSATVSATAATDLITLNRGVGLPGTPVTVGSLSGIPSVVPVPSGVSVLFGSVTGSVSGSVPASDVSVAVNGVPVGP